MSITARIGESTLQYQVIEHGKQIVGASLSAMAMRCDCRKPLPYILMCRVQRVVTIPLRSRRDPRTLKLAVEG
jgi:hypothetical protein